MLLYGADDELSKWVSVGVFGVDDAFDQATKSIGFVKSNKLIAATIYHNYHTKVDGAPHSIEMGIYTVDKRWASKAYLKAIFTYPFIQLCLERVQIITSIHNEGINNVASRLGFIKEGEHRRAYPNGDNAYSWSMLRPECRWINA